MLGRAALLEGLGETAAEILDRFVQERTIVVRRSTRSEADEIAVELVHEALIRTWPRLARWLDQGREETAFVAEAEQAAELWEQRGRRSEELWQGDALDDAWRILRRCATAVPARVERFLVAGREKQTLRQRRRRRFTVAFIGVLALIATVFTLLGVTAQRERARAELQRAEAQLEGARSAFNAGDPLQARAKLRMALETVDSTESRVLWQQLKGIALHWERSFHGMIAGADISPDGNRLAVAWGESLEVIDLYTREATAVVPESGPYMGGVKLADHGRLVLAWTLDETGISWVPERDVVLTTTGSRASAAAACTASANGLVACGRPDGSILLWNGATGEEVTTLSGHGEGVLDIKLSHDGDYLASLGMDQVLRLWDTRSAEVVLSTSHRRQIYPVLAFSPNARLVAAADDQQMVRVWDLAGGSEAAALAGCQSILKAIRFSPDGALLVAAGSGGFVRVWSTSTWQEQATLGGHTNNVTGLAFDTQGTMLASAASREPIRLWDVATWSLRRTLPGHDRKFMALFFSPDDRFLVSAGAGGQLRVWDLRNEQAKQTRTAGHQGTVYALDFSPNGSLLATGGTDGRIRIWETGTGAPVDEFSGQERVVVSVSFSPDGSHLVSAGTGRSIHLWELGEEPTLVRVDRRHQGSVYEVSFSPDGRLLASTTQATTYLIDAFTGERRLQLSRTHHGFVSNDAFSSDSARFTTFGQGNVLQEWDTATGSLLRESRSLPSNGTIEYVPGDTWVAVGTYEGSIYLWDTEHNRLRQVAAVPARINRIDVSPDGDTVGVALANGTARIIDLSTGDSLRLEGHGSETNTIRFSPDGRLVATAGDGGVVRLWHADSGRPYWRAPALLGKPLALLTHQGWRRLDPPGGLLPPPRERWRQSLETDAQLASQSASGELLCVSTYSDSLEIWDTSSDRRTAQLDDVAVRQAVALDTACVVRTEDGQALLVNRAGQKRLLRENAVADLPGELYLRRQLTVAILLGGAQKRPRAGEVLGREVEKTAAAELAARGMRQVLVDHARRRNAEKRGGGLVRVAFDEALGFPGDQGAGGKAPLSTEDLRSAIMELWHGCFPALQSPAVSSFRHV
ncbi:MAG: hypothetical protein GY856_55435 [bacterium]|nr:hypothetical protein [bacterium]